MLSFLNISTMFFIGICAGIVGVGVFKIENGNPSRTKRWTAIALLVLAVVLIGVPSFVTNQTVLNFVPLGS